MTKPWLQSRKNVFRIFFVFCFLISAFSFSQKLNADTTGLGLKRQNIKRKKEKIAVLRSDLIDFIKSGDKESVGKLFFEVKKYDDSLQMALYIKERYLLQVYTNDYLNFIEDLKESQTLWETKFNYTTKIKPPKDELFETLLADFDKTPVQKLSDIDNAILNDENLFFTKLGIQFLMFDIYKNTIPEDSLELFQDNINTICEKFVNLYPTSRFNDFIANEIHYKTKLSNFGWGMELVGTGGGMYGNLENILRPYGGAGLGLQFLYKKLFFIARYDVGFGGGLVGGRNLNYILPEIGIGYDVLKSNKIAFIPYVTYGTIAAFTSKKDDNYSYDVAPLLYSGIIFEIKFVSNHKASINPFTGKMIKPQQHTNSLRIKPFVSHSFQDLHEGGTFGLTIGWAFYSKRIKQTPLFPKIKNN